MSNRISGSADGGGSGSRLVGDADAQTGVSSQALIAATLLTIVISLLPVLVANWPPLHDYPFHIARADILARWHEAPELQRWYIPGSLLLPNVGTDWLMLTLQKVMSIETAGRVTIGLIIALTISGTVFLHSVVHRQFSYWPLVSAFFVYNWILLFGFINYLLGVALLLWALGAWIALTGRPIWLRLIVGTALSSIIFFCHIAAFGLFGLVVGGYELGRAWSRRRDLGLRVLPDLFVGAAIFIVPITLFFASRTGGAEAAFVYGSNVVLKKVAKFRMLFAADWPLDISLAVAMLIAAVVIWRFARFRLAKAMILPVLFVFAGYLLLPRHAMTGAYLDTRLVIPLMLVLIAATSVHVLKPRLRRVLTVVVLAFLTVRSVYLATQWWGYDREIQEVVDAFALIPDNSIVVAATTAPAPLTHDIDLSLWQPPIRFVMSFASLNRPVFVASTYAEAMQQPITVTPKYAGLYALHPDRDPMPVPDMAALLATRDRVRDVLARDGIDSEPVYMLVTYPQRLGVQPSDFPTLLAAGTNFMVVALNGWD